jgi:hypothetical protein
VRLTLTLLLWLLTTVTLALTVPVVWVQNHIVDRDGYTALARSAAQDPQLQEAMAKLLTTQVTALVSDGDASDLIGGVAAAYTASQPFPGQFGQANRLVHQFLFTDAVRRSGPNGNWSIDLAPMLADTSFEHTLASFDVRVPTTLSVPVTDRSVKFPRPGQFVVAARWGPWLATGAAIVTGIFALLTLAVARSRGRALAALGISGLLVGAGGWAGLEVARRYIDAALDRSDSDVRGVATAMVNHAEASLHASLNLTLAAGGVLVVFGIIASLLGSLLSSVRTG